MKTIDHVLRRLDYLKNVNVEPRADRERVRDIMDGGRAGLRALLGRVPTRGDVSVPAANLMLSGVTRLAQRLGAAPDLRVDPPNGSESERGKKAAEKKERLVECYDEVSQLEMMLPQVGRWLPGYGFTPIIINEKVSPDGFPYPCGELRDPYECFPAEWGPQQQPADLAFFRRVPRRDLVETYPDKTVDLLGRGPGRAVLLDVDAGRSGAGVWSQEAGWENRSGSGVEVAEYHCGDGIYIVVPDRRLLLDYIPNPLESGPAFVVMKKFAFNKLQGAFDQIVGLLAMMAKFNVLAGIAMEDGVFSETNVYGGVGPGQPYNRGRNAVNYFDQGTRVERPAQNLPYQLFQQIDRIEDQLRVTAGYSGQSDGESPNSFVTGRGLSELAAGANAEIEEYQTVLRTGLQMLDAKRLEWDERAYGDMRKPMAGWRRGAAFAEEYVPSAAIKGNYRTRRVYGAMASFDDPTKIVTGLQLMQAGVLSSETMMENVAGLDSVTKERQRIVVEAAEKTAMQGLLASAGDPAAPDHQKAVMAAIEMLPAGQLKATLQKYYTPDGDEMSPEEEALAGMMAQQGPPLPAAPPDMSQVLSGLTLGGEATGQARTMAAVPPPLGAVA